ncbi:hypothetical protein RN001_016116 [Aquatica leii]|uniref:DUF4371 domain-containing protein n=1 Tax=Aquatica leii TaxID=1421715 RepID=A0AAN7NX58_9COLE|nr:hypothetical protein RN001_016116 [Aquatica leii]
MNKHLRRVKNQEIMVHYLGKDIQNELMQILAGAIKNKILSLVKSAKYYSIILDCIPEVRKIVYNFYRSQADIYAFRQKPDTYSPRHSSHLRQK